MNPNTGEIKTFETLKDVPKGWINWNVHELVTVKNCAFRVQEVNIEDQTITLKAISKKMTKTKRDRLLEAEADKERDRHGRC